MATSFASDGNASLPVKNNGAHTDIEKQLTNQNIPIQAAAPKSLGAGTALAIGVFGTTLTTLSLSLMEWRGVTITNVYVANFFFAAAFGLVVTAQWELSIGNGFAYTVFSAFGLFYAGYAAILTPSFGIIEAYGDDTVQLNNALGFFMILWTVFVLTFLIASLPTNLVYIAIFFTVDLGFLTVAASYFAAADGHEASSIALKKAGGVFCFIAGLIGCAHMYCSSWWLSTPSRHCMQAPRPNLNSREVKLVNEFVRHTFLSSKCNMASNNVTNGDAPYSEYKQKWSSIPKDETGWLQRAQEVADVLAVDAGQRDRENKAPHAEVTLLKYGGLLKVLGPRKYGGGEQPWSAERFQKLIIENNYFIGGAVNPRDSDLKITSQGNKVEFEGFKHFNTGGVVSDLTVLEGVYESTEDHIFAFAPTSDPGIKFSNDWKNIGLRLTESGSVKIDKVAVPWDDALGWDPAKKQPRSDVLKIPFGSLLLPTIQLVFSNFYLGIALGAQSYASKYTTSKTRAWPFGGDNKEHATDEFYILSTYGNFHAHLRAAVALANASGEEVSKIYASYSGDLATRAKLTARERGELAEWVASTKVVTTDTGLRVTAGVFEVTGAKATSLSVGLDRFFRDIRTHTLHDPVAYKNRELGRFQLLDEVPEPTWYT
ncbi:hypothetical protein EJ04DRAFT_537962 [Polyplosphaeria fusca]|uniref:Acyl-CoA dehydrogenase C-terminal domain-containing protein n=1 Tax=Polyplosphaeria fusca TaxID=682080 RepID=A0A9P4QKV6_9PLEO|nr:hypothetical protein EJ04DRAFT_537962 [Polyplosphaeria fusca]